MASVLEKELARALGLPKGDGSLDEGIEGAIYALLRERDQRDERLAEGGSPLEESILASEALQQLDESQAEDPEDLM